MLLEFLGLNTVLVHLDAFHSNNTFFRSEEPCGGRVIRKEEQEQDKSDKGNDCINNHEPLPLVGRRIGLGVVDAKGEKGREDQSNAVALECPSTNNSIG